MSPPPPVRQRLQVRRVDVELLHGLWAAPFQGRVHSVFERVVNLEHGDGDLFTLAGHAVDAAPQTAIVDRADLGAIGIRAGDAVVAREGMLQIGDGVQVVWAGASTWRAHLPAYAAARLPAQLLAARARLGGFGAPGREAVQGMSRGGFALEVASALEQRSCRLLDALARGQHEEALGHAVSLVGLGPGLTPSGDDFLVGLFAVLNVRGSPCCGWLGGGAAVLPHARHATHAISLAALRAAAAGRVRESISALLEALMHGTPAALEAALQRVLAIGATSGADIAAGILAGLELNLHVQAVRSGQARQPTFPTTTLSRHPRAAARAADPSPGALAPWPSKC